MMTFAGLIITASIIIVFTQWQTPLIYMHMKGKYNDKSFKKMKWIGNVLSYIMIPLMFATITSYQFFPEFTEYLLLSMGIIIVLMIGYSIFLYRISNNDLENEDVSIKRSMKMPLIIMIVTFVASIYEFVLLSRLPESFVSIKYIVNFNLTSNIAFKMILRIFLFSFVTVTAYVLLVYSAIHHDKPNENGLRDIKTRLRKKRIYFVITISVVLSFFHLAEVDTYTVATEDEVRELCGSLNTCDDLDAAYAKYDDKFDATTEVFYLVATALFIPLFIDELHSDTNKINRTVNRNAKKRRLRRWRR